MPSPYGHIPIGRHADHPHAPICLSDQQRQGHTFILGDPGSGADRILASVAVCQAHAGRLTVILDPGDNIRGHLDIYPYPGTMAHSYDSFAHAPAHNPLAPDVSETDTDIRDAIRYNTHPWDDRLDQILPRTFEATRQHNRRYPGGTHLDLEDLRAVQYPTAAASKPVLRFGATAVDVTDSDYRQGSDASGLCADIVRQIGQRILDEKRKAALSTIASAVNYRTRITHGKRFCSFRVTATRGATCPRRPPAPPWSNTPSMRCGPSVPKSGRCY